MGLGSVQADPSSFLACIGEATKGASVPIQIFRARERGRV